MKYQILLFAFLLGTYVQADQGCDVATEKKADCGYSGIDQDGCESKGCCWQPTTTLEMLINKYRNPNSSNDTPWCYYHAEDQPCQDISFEASDPGFDSDWIDGMKKLYYQNLNIQGKGGVVASPDDSTPGGSYYYHWERDGALSMRAYMNINNKQLDAIEENMNAYIEWVTRVQNEEDPNEQDVRTEPKYNLPDGDVFTDGWCRPQNDGPGLRATTMIMYAQILLKAGKDDYVKKYMWTDGDYNGGTIKYDLAWVLESYTENSCDLWEEIRSDNMFWNRMSHRQAMLYGAAFAKQMGDSDLASQYEAKQKEIEGTLSQFWNGTFLLESNNREKDSAVIHAIATLNDDYYDITGHEVTGTIDTLNMLFCLSFQVNQDDNKAKVPGILYGRYEGDGYAGGNPWQLLTASLAHLFYQQSSKFLDSQNESFTQEYLKPWRKILNLSENPDYMEMALKASQAGDAVMNRIYQHVKGDNYRIDEQIDRNTGNQASAKGLTWSYSNVLETLVYRNSKLMPRLNEVQNE